MSSRAHITPTSFVNTYEWGNFRGDPRVLLAELGVAADVDRGIVELRSVHRRKVSLLERRDRAGM